MIHALVESSLWSRHRFGRVIALVESSLWSRHRFGRVIALDMSHLKLDVLNDIFTNMFPKYSGKI
jgi:hypothetical protein